MSALSPLASSSLLPSTGPKESPQLSVKTEDSGGQTTENDGSLQSLREKHASILNLVSSIQGKTARIMLDQEKELVRAFRTRLSEVGKELEKERAKNESGSTEWVTRCRKLTEELEFLKELTSKLTYENRSLNKENRKMKKQLKVQTEDREFLIAQLVASKKEVQRLKDRFSEVESKEEMCRKA